MASNPNYCNITPEIEALAALALQNSSIDPDDYAALDGEAILESAIEFYNS